MQVKRKTLLNFNKSTRKALLTVFIGIIFLVIFAIIFSDIVSFIIISLILVAILSPLVNRLAEIYVFGIRLPRILAILITFGLLGSVLFGILTMFVPLVSNQVELIKTLKINEITAKISLPIENLEKSLIYKFGIKQQMGFIFKQIGIASVQVVEKFNIGNIINNFLSITTGILVGTLAVSFVTFSILMKKGVVRNQIINIIPNQYFEVGITAIYKIEKLLSNYLRGVLLQITAAFMLIALGLSLFGINYAVTIALFAAFVHFIPYLGPILSITFGVLVGVSTASLGAESGEIINTLAKTNVQKISETVILIKILIVFVSVYTLDSVFFQPLIFSKSVKAHPLEIFLVIFAGATLAGVVGMILAIPTYTILKVIMTEFLVGYRQYYIFQND